MEPSRSEKVKFEEEETEDLVEEISRLRRLLLINENRKFKYWESLPLEIRCMIAKKTDLKTRFSLMFSSKANYNIARSVPIKIASISVRDEDMLGYSGRNILIELKEYDTSEAFTVVCFEQGSRRTKVHRYRRLWNEKLHVCCAKAMIFENLNNFKASVLFMKNFIALTDYKVDEFEIGVEDWGRDFVFLNKLRIKKKLKIHSSDENNFNRWFNTATLPLEKLEIYIPNEYSTLNSDRRFELNHPTIRNSKEIRIYNCSDFREERLDFSEIKCGKFLIYGPEVTSQSVNLFVKRWINGDGLENLSCGRFSNFELSLYEGSLGGFLNGLNHLPWNYEFLDKRSLSDLAGFNINNATCYYIESRKKDNGAALIFGRSEVVFLVTGKRPAIE